MAINIADNMGYNGKKPLDGRTEYATLSAMKSVVDANINEGCLAYNKEDGKYYKFLSTNTVDPTTGKWREFETGGGGETYNDFTGATASTAGAHGLVPAPSAGDEGKVLFGNGAWGALPSVDLSVLSNEAFQLSATEKAVGTYTDSNNVIKILYAKTIKGTSPSNSTDTVIYTFNSDEECVAINGALLSGCVPINYTGSSSSWYSRCYVENSNPDRLHLQVAGYTNAPYSIAVFYTKTTDSPLPSGVKFAGVWYDGSVKLKKTFVGSGDLLLARANWTNLTSYFGIDMSVIGKVVNATLLNNGGTEILCPLHIGFYQGAFQIYYDYTVQDTMTNGILELEYIPAS